MVEDRLPEVQVWALATEEVTVAPFVDEGPMTPERLRELRTVLAALATAPIATLEVHPLPAGVDRSRGIALGNASPLARYLSQLIGQTPASGAASSGGNLYRMVVPAKVAAQFGSGLIQLMLSSSVPSGIRSALMNFSGTAGQAAFVQVAGKGAAAALGGGALTVAPPLIMMAVAAGLSARSEMASQRIAELLDTMHEDALDRDRDRNSLESCRIPIEKATAIVLDQGAVGHSLGLSSAVDKIETAITAARRHLKRWEKALADLPDGPVEAARITKDFPGIEDPSGAFRAHLELAELAINLKRRVNVLQAVEHAQLNPDNAFERFMRELSADEKSVDELEGRIAAVLRRLSALEVDRGHGLFDFVFTLGEVDDLLRMARLLRELGEGVDTSRTASDVAIEMVREADGSVVVFPALAEMI